MCFRVTWTHLDVGEKHLQHVGAWVSGVEEHELGLLQVVWGKPFLDVQMSGLRKSSRDSRAGRICLPLSSSLLKVPHRHGQSTAAAKPVLHEKAISQAKQATSFPKPQPASSFRCKRVRGRLHGTYKYSGKHFEKPPGACTGQVKTQISRASRELLFRVKLLNNMPTICIHSACSSSANIFFSSDAVK